MNRSAATLALFLALLPRRGPAVPDCLSGGPTLPECVASQPDLAGFQTDLVP